ncbi:chitinase [Paenibacillus sp. ACRRX]|uniref:chitinase n=1 Tax=Paenibacillus sp. ACRRX TaxID=2918206 RepID=UPI001EF6BA97|nr:chitinase [Paenibacillus sp. ACRRX]MCG7407316.1 chitinase [Paenibacillus sp. ACRRX]
MSARKNCLTRRLVHRTVSLSVGASLVMTPLTAFASDLSAAGRNISTYSTEQVHNSSSHHKSHTGDRYNQESSLQVGESRLLTRKEIRKEWDGIDPDYVPDKAVEAVKAALPQQDYEQLFPYRLGSTEWHKAAKGKDYYNANQTDYFSYDNLIQAVAEVANIKYKVISREGDLNAQEVYRFDKDARAETLVSRSANFNSDINRKRNLVVQIVDYGSFLKEGTKKDRKRELAALLANLSHETGGGWDTAPGGPLRWGLFWNENIAGRTGKNTSNFVDPNSSELYPGYKDKRYYGRGPIMLSWNFNYGLFSSVIYGDKEILLKNPEIVAADGKVGFMTAILFWMTPQAPKPSAHDVMVGKWKPTKELTAKGLSSPGFGVTIMVLNGLEANLGETDGSPVKRRAGHYRDITGKMGINISNEKLDTLGMKPF